MSASPVMPLPKAIAAMLQETPELRQAYLVGGCVRDWLLGMPVTDYDIEAFEIGFPELLRALSRWGRAKLVGRSFGTVKLRLRGGLTLDVSLPRRAFAGNAQEVGEAAYDPSLSPADAAARRDFTINALLYDPRQQRLLDFVGGMRDLKDSVLRHTSEAFAEDPLRVLRGMQLASRFNLAPAPETVTLCRQMIGEYGQIAAQRVWEEWHKWVTQSTSPSVGLRFLVASDWSRHFPEIHALRGTPQDPEWHPEGDVFRHTCYCCDAMVSLPGWQAAASQPKAVYLFAILAHDFGKPQTTQSVQKGERLRTVSPGHDRIGALRAEDFLRRIHAPKEIIRRVKPLVKNHLAHLQTPTDRAVRRLAQRLAPETIESLTLVMSADHMGRHPQPAIVPESVRALEQKAAALRVAQAAPVPVLKGRHLLQLGMTPGPDMGAVLRAAHNAQLEGAFNDLEGALRWVKGHIESPMTGGQSDAAQSERPWRA
ncbi:MAG: polynucleotide adenylyltransferase [Gammaproteobacteria bacterium]